PPTSLGRVSLDGIQVLNDTAGRVSDVETRTWASAFLRTFGYLNWALSRGQDQFLIQSGLSSAPLAVFESNIAEISEARQAGARIEYRPQTFRRRVVRAVPQSLEATIRSVRYTWTPYAIYLDALGPAETDLIDAHGQRTVRSRTPAGAAMFELVGGELSHNPLMG